MTKASFRRLAGLACLAPGLVFGAGCRQPTSAPAAAAAAPRIAAPAEILAAIPEPTGGKASDLEIRKWTEKARAKPDDAGAWTSLGDALMQRVRETADQTCYGHAERAYQRALLLKPDRADALTGMAWVEGGRHNFDRSIEWARKALALDPKNHTAYGIIGDAEVELGEYETALDDYQKMLDIRPDISSYSRGAYLLHLAGDNRKARWLMAKAVLSGGPYAENTAWCRAQLALILFSDGNLLAAEQAATEGVKAHPNNAHVLAAMGRVKTARKDYKAAIDFYKRSLAAAPDHNAHAALGDLYLLTGDKRAAEAQFSLLEQMHARQDAGGVPHTHLQLAHFYADHDRKLVEALRMAEERKDSKNVFEADTVAWVYYKNGEYAKAKEAILRALRLKTPDAKIPFHAGMIYAKLGDTVAARKYLHRALSLNPHFSPVHARTASETLAQLGRGGSGTASARTGTP